MNPLPRANESSATPSAPARDADATVLARSRSDAAETRWGWLCAGLALATGATLALEIVLTRIFSVILWYHYGFMSISMALFGIGLAGVYVYLFPERFGRDRAEHATARAALVFALATLAALLGFHWIVSVQSHWPLGIFHRTLIFLVTGGPFFFAGLTVAIPLSRFTERIGVLYSADLLGAAAGAVLVIPLLAWLGGHASLIACAALASLAAACFAAAARSRSLAIGAGLALALSVAGIAFARETDFFRIRYVKRGRSQEDVIAEAWNSFSRVTVSAADSSDPARRISIDGGAATPMIPFSGDLQGVRDLGDRIQALGYYLRPYEHALILGAGGGPDILTAKLFEVERVQAVEINPLIVDFVRDDFRDFSGSPYDLPGVSFAVLDGRSYVAQSEEEFDLILLSEVDTTAAQAAGALTLVENSLYTVEAFQDYHDHLAEDGVLSITRNWNVSAHIMALRTVDMIQIAWRSRGCEEVERHVVVVAREGEDRAWGTLLASRQPFSDEALGRIRQVAERQHWRLVFDPGRTDNPPTFQALFGPEREAFLREYAYDVRATTDDRPYYFFFLKPLEFLFGESTVTPEEELDWGSKRTPRILMQLFGLVLALVLVFSFLIPITLGRLRFGSLRGAARGLSYFAAIGLGFILVELSLIQRYTLVLGQPLYAFACILGCLLVFSRLGSLLTHSFREPRRAARAVLLAVLLCTLVHAFAGPLLLSRSMGLGLPWRIALTFLSIAPLGFLMGMPLPLGMRMVQQDSPRSLAWAWGVNGSLSVVGSVVAMVISIFTGITSTIVVGSLMYALALAACTAGRRGALPS